MDDRRADALPVRYAGLDDIVNRVPVLGRMINGIPSVCDAAAPLEP